MTAPSLARPLPGHDPAGSPPWPLALALGAYRLGYFLLDVVDVRTAVPSDSDADAWATATRLVTRVAADALVISCIAPAVFPGRLPDTLTSLPLRLLAGWRRVPRDPDSLSG